MRDWRSHPAWGPVGVFVGILSLLPPAPTLVKALIFIVIIALSVYAFFGRNIRRKRMETEYHPLPTQEQRVDAPASQGVLNHRAPSLQVQHSTPYSSGTPAYQCANA